MMKYLALISFALVVVSCRNNNKGLNTTATAIIKKNTSTQRELSNNMESISNDTIHSILGIWVLKGTDNPAFEVRPSTIYYPEHFKSYKYYINGDSIRIVYDGYSESFAYKLQSRDTLELNNYDYGLSVYYRKKP